MTKVSVIIPTYNRDRYIVKTLQSVFAQTFTDYEVIVVDDGSTDNTSEVLKPYLDRIIYIQKPNGGQGSARNAGIKIAKGEYIAFLDSDDLWLPDKLRLQVEFLSEHKEVGLVFTDDIMFSEDSTGNLIELEKKIFSGSDLSFLGLFRKNVISNLTVMVRRECMEQVGFFDESRELIGGEDYEMWLRIAMKYKLGHIPEILAEYRVHRENIIGIDLEKCYVMHLKVINKILSNYPQITKEFNINMPEYYRDYYYRFGRDLYQRGQCSLALKYLKISLKHNILSPKAVILFIFSWVKSLDRRKYAKVAQ